MSDSEQEQKQIEGWVNYYFFFKKILKRKKRRRNRGPTINFFEDTEQGRFGRLRVPFVMLNKNYSNSLHRVTMILLNMTRGLNLFYYLNRRMNVILNYFVS